jgi:uncharacterized membrane protein YhhN
VIAAFSAALHIRAEYHGPRWQIYLFKPLTTTLLLAGAALTASEHGLRYQIAITVGLALSLAGDVCLMWPRDRFLAGLACFLLAHLAYLFAFTSAVPLGTAPALLVPVLAIAVAVNRLLWSNLGRLRLAVLLYTAVIAVMVWQAWARQWTFATLGSGCAAAGASLFMGSDALLALNRFRRPFPGAQSLIMGTYVVAQALIALSIGVT